MTESPYDDPGEVTMVGRGNDEAFVPEESPSWLQLGVIVSDGSVSMTWPVGSTDGAEVATGTAQTKAQAVSRATLDFLDRMQGGRMKSQFRIGWVSFHDFASKELPPKTVDETRQAGDFDPTGNGVGGTQIWTGLEAAIKMVEEWQANPPHADLPMSAVVVLMTDGEDGAPDKTRELAKRLKALPNTTLAACFFATKGASPKGADHLRTLVTEPEAENFKQVYNSEALRDFFHASITNVAG